MQKNICTNLLKKYIHITLDYYCPIQKITRQPMYTSRNFGARSCKHHCSANEEFIRTCILFWISASNRNEYQEYFLVGKGDRCL